MTATNIRYAATIAAINTNLTAAELPTIPEYTVVSKNESEMPGMGYATVGNEIWINASRNWNAMEATRYAVVEAWNNWMRAAAKMPRMRRLAGVRAYRAAVKIWDKTE